MQSKVVSICRVLPLAFLAVSLVRDLSPMTVADWHQKHLGSQLARGKRTKHMVGPSSGLRDHIDAGQEDRFVQVVHGA